MIKVIKVLIAGYLWIFVAHAQRFVLNDGTGKVFGFGGNIIGRSKGTSQSWANILTDILKVNIRCSNDPINGLTCAAEYPDKCREQWNFPNPCTRQNLDMNITKFVHPFDKSKFLMCGQLGKLYVVQCPQYEVFHDGCGQCVGEEAGLTPSCEIPLPPVHNNPCTREAILANKLFFPFPGNLSKFIHCDIWGKPWERICTPGEVWSQWDVTCVLPHLLNPCNRPTTDLNYLYSHPCDPAKYLTCDAQGRAHEINCALGEAFYERNQRCQPYRDFEDQILSSFCENYIFGFRRYHGNGGFAIDPSRTAESVDLGLVTHEGIKVAGTGAISGIMGGGFNRDSRGFTMDRTTRNLDGSVRFSSDGAGQGIRANVDLRGGVLNRQTELQGQGDGTIGFDRSSQVRGGKLSGQITTDGQGGVESSFEVKRGTINGSKSSMVDVIQTHPDQGTGTIDQIFNGGAATNFVDIRGKALSNGPTTAEFVDIRNQGTSGTSANMIDIRGEKGSGTRDMFDIRSGTAEGIMTDIRGSQVVESGGMLDIRGQDVGGGSGNTVDVRGGKVSGTKKMVDVRGGSTDGNLGIKTSHTEVSGGMIDINKGSTPIVNGGSKMVDVISGGKMVDIRGGISGNVLTDIRTSTTEAGGSLIDLGVIEGITGGTDGNMVESRISKTEKSGGMADIRGTKVDTSGIIGGSSGGEFVDIRTVKLDTTGGMSDTTGSQVDTPVKVDILDSNIDSTGGDIGGMVDIRGSTIDTTVGMIDTSGNIRDGSNMVDIRTPKGDTSSTLIDFGGFEGVTGNIGDTSMVDIRGSQFQTSNGKVDIRKATGDTSGMVDIRGSKIDTTSGMLDTSGMVDIRNVDKANPVIDFSGFESGTTSSGGSSMVGIRGSKTEVNVRKSPGVTSGMVDILGSKIDTTGGMLGTSGRADIRDGSSMVDIRIPKGDTSSTLIDFGGIAGVTGKLGDTSMVDIRGSEFETSKSKVDIRKATGDTSGMVDIRGSKIDTTGGMLDTSGMVDIRNVDSTGPIIDFGGLESGTAFKSGTGMVDIRGSKIDSTRTAVDISGSHVDTSGIDFGIGGKNDANVDIRGSKIDTSGSMMDIRGAQIDKTGVVDVIPGSISESSSVKAHGSRTKTSGVEVDITGKPSGIPGGVMVDIRREGIIDMPVSSDGTDIIGKGIGSMDRVLTDIRAGEVSGKKTVVDIRDGATESGFLDITGFKTGLSSNAVDITSQGSGTGGVDVNMIDIRGGKGFGANNMVDIRGGMNDGKMVDIRGSKTERTGGVIDVTGGDGNSQLDIIGGKTSKTMVDIRGKGHSILEGTGTGPLNAGAGVKTEKTMIDVRNQPLSGQTSDVQWVDIRNKQGQGSVIGTNEMGLGGMTTIDLRKQLGLAGQGGLPNDLNAGATEVTRTDTITIEGTVQGAQSSGTMQDLLNTWNKIIGGDGTGRHTFSQITGRRGMSSGGVFDSGLNPPGNGKLIDARLTVHPSRLRMYDYSDIPFNEPCTQENIDAGRTHFRFRNHPHMFLQCDASGRMHRMPCSTKGRDWFDVYTNTCVDGPVHVENLIL